MLNLIKERLSLAKEINVTAIYEHIDTTQREGVRKSVYPTEHSHLLHLLFRE